MCYQNSHQNHPVYCVFSTSEGVQYIGLISWFMWGISWIHLEMFNTLEGYHDLCGGTSWVHRRWRSVHPRDTISTLGDIMVHVGEQLIKVFDFYWKPRCTEHLLMYSWYPPTWIMISPTCNMVSLRCTHDIPHMNYDIPRMQWKPSDVLMIKEDAYPCKES